MILPSWMGLNDPDCPLTKPVTSLPAYPILSNTTVGNSQLTYHLATQHYYVTARVASFAAQRLQVDSPGVFRLPVKSHVYGPISPVLDYLFRSGKKQFVLNVKDFHR